jgi:uncharacterized protein involved in exopolysaccharide biosynthesis
MNIKSKISHEDDHTNNSALLPLEQATNKLFRNKRYIDSEIKIIQSKQITKKQIKQTNKRTNKQTKKQTKPMNIFKVLGYLPRKIRQFYDDVLSLIKANSR